VDDINTFLKLKAVASGFLAWVRTHYNEESYIKAFYESEDVNLDLTPYAQTLIRKA
jgi:hypothetical protein